MSIKRNFFILLNENVPDVKEKRKNWTKNLLNYNAEKIAFVDESGVNINMTRIYGRSLGGTRCVDKTPLNTPINTTILYSIRINGESAYTTYEGGITGEKFVEYLKNTLIPTIH